MATQSLSVDLALPAVPAIQDPQLFEEALKIYNALRIVASALDDYTGQGTFTVELQISTAQVESQVVSLRSEVAELKEQLALVTSGVNWQQPGELGEITPNTVAATDLTATTINGGVTKLGITTTTTFACNGKAAQASYALPASATDLPTVITLANALKTMAINNGIGA